ncbi:MAG: hypothetical protein IT319_20310 [Anaerolineae bacterium]|nr:hypothetical protein [Anaerolineae bacterium]
MSENMPDFDSMSQEEIMAWMETLAKRQGASEGFTTAADMDIAEIDPSTVVIDEPGYVPYGQEDDKPKAAPAAAAPPPAPRMTTPTPVPAQPAAKPAPPPPPTPGVTGTLAWLESLAADQTDDLFNLDLSDAPLKPAAPPPSPPAPVVEAPKAPAAAPTDPMAWLEDLARSQVAEESLERLGADDEEESEKLDPFAQGVNPMEWLETLAKRQGAKDEELTTDARMNIPQPGDTEVEDEEYQPFSFDTLPTRRTAEPEALENPAQWLESLAGEEGYSEDGVLATQVSESEDDEMSIDAIEDAISTGTVTREQMQYFLDQQADQLAEEDEYLEAVDDLPPEPAELPDWLSQMRPVEDAPTPTKPLDEMFAAPPSEAASTAMPDWLTSDMIEGEESDLESIFEPEEESAPSEPVIVASQSAAEVEVDPNDPWTEAFDAEYEQGGEIDITTVPGWYQQNIADPARVAAVDQQIADEEALPELAEAALAEEKDLAAGQPQPIPVWMGGEEQPAEPEPVEVYAAAEVDVFGDVPDWLKEVEDSVTPEEVPDWLVETIAEPEVFAAPEPEPEPVQAVVTPLPTPAPTPAPARVPEGEVAAVLERARDRERSGDLEGALADYESMIRSSTELEAVVAELTQLVRSYKTTPSVYRVLGDGLMRQGKLQAALNTYREALNQL